MDLLMGFAAGLLFWDWVILLAVFSGGFWSLNKESGAAFAVLIGFGLWYFANITFSWVGVGVYVLIGFLWLLFKFRRYVAKMIETETENIKIKKELTTKSEMKHKIWNNIEFDVIFFWGIAWPFSVLGFFLYDFMEILWEKFKKLVGGYVDKMIVAAGFTD